LPEATMNSVDLLDLQHAIAFWVLDLLWQLHDAGNIASQI
jgi:hypothetical protein